MLKDHARRTSCGGGWMVKDWRRRITREDVLGRHTNQRLSLAISCGELREISAAPPASGGATR